MATTNDLAGTDLFGYNCRVPWKRLLLLTVASALVLAIIALAHSNILLRSETDIRASLLRQTPLGTSSADVRAFLEKKGWLDTNYVGSHGFLKQEPGKPIEIVGITSLQGYLG